jgi:hypothetical protein
MERAAEGSAAGDAARNGQAGAGPRDLACLGEIAPETPAAELPGDTDCIPCRPRGGIASSARRVTERAEERR